MTRAELARSLWSGELAVGWRAGLGFGRSLQLACLKAVAMVGYYRGKASTLRAGLPPEVPREAPDSPGPDQAALADLRRRIAEGAALKLAVVIPFFARTPAETAHLLEALGGLAAQTRAPDAVLLVDDASPLPLPPNLGNSQVQILRQPVNRGPAAARNVGLRTAREQGADVACFLDADCVPAPDWLEQMEAGQRAQPGIVCGLTRAARPDTAIGLYHDVCGTLNGRLLADGSLLYGPTCNLSVSLAAVRLGFDEAFRAAAFEDVDFCVRARERACPAALRPAAAVRHHYDSSVAGLYRQFRRYGAAEPLMQAKHGYYLSWLAQSRVVPSL